MGGGGGGGILGGITRGVAAVATGGLSELARPKPFQPGGSNNPLELTKQAALGTFGAGSALAAYAFRRGAPPRFDTSSIDIDRQARAAANAVQSAEAEGRRARAAKRQSSALGTFTTGPDSTSAATLQPAPARKSVLG